MSHAHRLNKATAETRESIAEKLCAAFLCANPGMDVDTAAAKAEATLVTVTQLLMKRSGISPMTVNPEAQARLPQRTIDYFHNCMRPDQTISLCGLRSKMLRTVNDTKNLAITERGVPEAKADETAANSHSEIDALGLSTRARTSMREHVTRTGTEQRAL